MTEMAAEAHPEPQAPASSAEGLRQLERQIAEHPAEEAQVVVPRGTVLCVAAFNNEKQIGRLVSRALKVVDKVIVCDDGSMDETAKVAREAGAFVIRHKEGLGKGKAMADLMEEAMKAQPRIVVTMEVEKHNDPDQIPELIEPLLRDEADIAIGTHEDGGVPVKGGELLAFNSKALAARTRDDFFSSNSSTAQMATAMASGLRTKIVTFKSAALPPPPVAKVKAPVTIQERWDKLMRRLLVEKPFFFIGAPGIELSIAGAVLLVVALVSYNGGSPLNIPLLVVGFVVLLCGLMLAALFGIIYTISHLNRGRAEPQK
jgi:hypothetical protein